MRGCLVGCGCLTLAVTVVLGLVVVGAVALFYPYYRAGKEVAATGCPQQAPAQAPLGRAVCPVRIEGLEFTGGRSYRLRGVGPGEPTGLFQRDRDRALVVGFSYRSTIPASLQASLAALRDGRVVPVAPVGGITLRASSEGWRFQAVSLPDSAGRYAAIL
ncbi:MAG: hypothetical protein QN193_09000 [Armatimonadota bacterium]|nr:hypothetical protein [Armatimonadota bacterium]MDR7444373.1 hypothetical protein [Armatimonadota bacterium]MDR7570730.1 hypothetical protein [Armatimonadota bacterium]MDR7614860.1 hypothetical protein [Armatimonadota bacterium]